DAQENYFAAAFGVVVTAYFWWKNIQGIHESSEKALRIMQITTVMVVLLIAWCVVTLVMHPAHLPPLPSRAALKMDHESLGWLYHSWAANLTWVLLLVGFGHSVLAMSGEESLAQVNREIEHPKLKNLERTGLVIFLYSLFFTSLVSFFAVMIIPDGVRPNYFGNLIGGLAMNVVGPFTLKLFFQGFVVLVGVLILSGAVNTAIVGANGVLNRISEDGVLTPWFRHPQTKYGTTHRIINLIAILQILTIVASGGNVYIGKIELPIGLGLISILLFATAIVNLFTKQLATISGIAFSLFLFGVFTVSERISRKSLAGKQHDLEQFRVNAQEDISAEAMEVRPGNVLVAVRDPRNLAYLRD